LRHKKRIKYITQGIKSKLLILINKVKNIINIRN
jgi:hypothetical protein